MPIDRTHAFSSGITYPLKPGKLDGWRLRIPASLLRRIFYCLDYARFLVAADQFRRAAVIGSDCLIGPNAWCRNMGVNSAIHIGDGVICRGVLCIEKGAENALLTIGDNIYIGDDCLISCLQHIQIGKYTLLAHGVQIFDNDSHPIDASSRERDYLYLIGRLSGSRLPVATAPVIIGDKVWIGFGSAIMKAVTLGDGAIVAAMSVVTKDVPPWTLVAGNPARVIRELPH